MKTLRLILGDQLNHTHSWFKKADDSVLYVLMEIRTETDYAWHHIQKVIAFFAAMRNFKDELEAKGHTVVYLEIDNKKNQQSFEKNISALIAQNNITHFEYQLPDEYRLDELLKAFASRLSITYTVADTEHFFTTRPELEAFFEGKKTYLMESFYRYMRRKHNVLMDGAEPLTGQWNYDTENRKKLPADHKPTPPLLFHNNVSQLHKQVIHAGIKTNGTVDAKDFIWPINRKQCLRLLSHFLKECLPLFGTYEDAMMPGEWSLYHSRLSFAMNTKMLSPKEVIEKAVSEWQKRKSEISFNQLEGFVRQIIGWREYMRGMYWAKMPGFRHANFFRHQNKLPAWYWTGDTKMNCLRHCIKQSLSHAYAHHIQRLMVTGNFALLAGAHPDEVDAWYLGIYIDAIEWVEITNTRGMSQFGKK